jgi:hypothetical protein
MQTLNEYIKPQKQDPRTTENFTIEKRNYGEIIISTNEIFHMGDIRGNTIEINLININDLFLHFDTDHILEHIYKNFQQISFKISKNYMNYYITIDTQKPQAHIYKNSNTTDKDIPVSKKDIHELLKASDYKLYVYLYDNGQLNIKPSETVDNIHDFNTFHDMFILFQVFYNLNNKTLPE